MTIKPNGFEQPHLLPALFETDKTNPYLAKAAELREIFAQDAIERDQLGGRPHEQIKLLKETGLVNLLIPKEFGGAGERYSTAMRIVREFAKVDGSVAHLYGYHFSPLQNAVTTGPDERSRDILRRSAAGR